MKTPFDDDTFVPDEESWVEPETQAELARLRKVKVHEPMDEALFWQILEKSRDFMYDTYKQEEFLSLYLDRFTLSQIIGFRLTTQKLVFEAYNQKSWYAGSILNEILYDAEEFQSFLYLVISRGKAVYQAFLQNPDSLIDALNDDLELYDFDDFNSAAEMAFQGKADVDLYDIINLDDYAYASKNYPEIEVSWGNDVEADDETTAEQLQAHCPRLYEKYWKDKNNDKVELKQLGKVSEPMDESVFWQIIEKSRDFIYDTFKQEEFIALYLERFSLKEIIGFRLTTQKLIFGAYNQKSWYAGSILNNVLDDVEDFEAFLCLIISRGKAVYQAFLQSPDSLVNEFSEEMDFYDFDHFNEAADTAFDLKADAELSEFIDFKNFAYSSQNYPQIRVPWGDEFYDTNADDQLKLYCPKLYEKFWEDDEDDDDDEY
jgi:hypothetical protein